MKMTIEIDCTPQEAREALGLPDMKSVQDGLMADLEERMRGAVESMDTEALLKAWMPINMQGLEGLETLQKAFWSRMTSGPDKAPSPE